jgi:hypothetical protein
MDYVVLRNPETDQTWECPVRAADAWVDKGWVRVESEKSTSTSARRRGDQTQEKSNG